MAPVVFLGFLLLQLMVLLLVGFDGFDVGPWLSSYCFRSLGPSPVLGVDSWRFCSSRVQLLLLVQPGSGPSCGPSCLLMLILVLLLVVLVASTLVLCCLAVAAGVLGLHQFLDCVRIAATWGGSPPMTSREVHRTLSFRGRRSRNKVSVRVNPRKDHCRIPAQRNDQRTKNKLNGDGGPRPTPLDADGTGAWGAGLFLGRHNEPRANAPRNFNKRAMLPSPRTWDNRLVAAKPLIATLLFDPSMSALPIIVKRTTKCWIVHPPIGN
ncbi:hypothetical protein NL676_007133, partial [Syzygium grande]